MSYRYQIIVRFKHPKFGPSHEKTMAVASTAAAALRRGFDDVCHRVDCRARRQIHNASIVEILRVGPAL